MTNVQIPMTTQAPIKFWSLIGHWSLVIGIFLIPVVAHAQIVPPCNAVPNQASNLPTCGVDQLIELLVNIYNFLLGLAALLTMLFVVFGGVRMLYFSYWEDSAAELQAAKLTVRRAIGGFIIIAMAYLLVNTALTMLGVSKTSQVGILLGKFGLFK